jgi:hypothetical protein
MGEKLLTGVVTTEWERRYPTIYELRPTPNMDTLFIIRYLQLLQPKPRSHIPHTVQRPLNTAAST